MEKENIKYWIIAIVAALAFILALLGEANIENTLYINATNATLGEMYNFSSAGWSFPIAASDVYYNITNMSMSHLVNMYFDPDLDALIINESGFYRISGGLSFQGGNNAEYGLAVARNNSINRHCYNRVTTAALKDTPIEVNCIDYLLKGDVLQLQIDDEANPANSILIKKAIVSTNKLAIGGGSSGSGTTYTFNMPELYLAAGMVYYNTTWHFETLTNGITNNLTLVYTYIDNGIVGNISVIYTYIDQGIAGNKTEIINYIDNAISGNKTEILTYVDNGISGNVSALYTYIDQGIAGNKTIDTKMKAKTPELYNNSNTISFNYTNNLTDGQNKKNIKYRYDGANSTLTASDSDLFLRTGGDSINTAEKVSIGSEKDCGMGNACVQTGEPLVATIAGMTRLFYVEGASSSTANAGLSLISGATGTSYLYFGSVGDPSGANINYAPATDLLTMYNKLGDTYFENDANDKKFYFNMDTASTTGQTSIIIMDRDTSGTPSTGFGGGFRIMSDGVNRFDNYGVMGTASNDGDGVFNVFDSGSGTNLMRLYGGERSVSISEDGSFGLSSTSGRLHVHNNEENTRPVTYFHQDNVQSNNSVEYLKQDDRDDPFTDYDGDVGINCGANILLDAGATIITTDYYIKIDSPDLPAGHYYFRVHQCIPPK